MARKGQRWPRYVPVAERRRAAEQKAKSERKKGRVLLPVNITGRAIATTFWGKAWCKHLEKFSDFSNRLPRGRNYARNGSVIDLQIDTGKITAMVSGSYTYHIIINIDPIAKKQWNALKSQCVGSIDSALELLQGKLSNSVMQTMCNRNEGLFPTPKEIRLSCDCPDWADLCKHLAAVLYGVGARLDQSPELLFLLRGVDYQELVGTELAIDTSSTATELSGDLSGIFGIEIDTAPNLSDTLINSNSKKSKSKRAAGKLHKKRKKKKATAKSPTAKTPSIKASDSKSLKTKSPTSKPRASSGDLVNISRGVRASHIIKLRKLHQLTQQDFAQLTGKTIATVRSWEARSGVLSLQSKNKLVLQKIFSMTPKQIATAIKRKNK